MTTTTSSSTTCEASHGPSSIDRFYHPHYLFRLVGCLPVLIYWSSFLTTAIAPSAFDHQLAGRSQLSLSIPLMALPFLVLIRLRQVRKKFHLTILSAETILDSWLTHFVVFNLGSLGYLGGWIALFTYLAWLISFGLLFPKPPYQGTSKLRVVAPETFASEVLNQTYATLVGFSAGELLGLTTEKLEHELRGSNKLADLHPPNKQWIIWPLPELRKRSHVGFMDLEVILANLSLQYRNSNEIEFIILDTKNLTSVCSVLKIWSEDDSASAPGRADTDQLILLHYQGGKEVNRLPPRPLNHDDSSDEEEKPVERLNPSTVLWGEETIRKAFNLK